MTPPPVSGGRWRLRRRGGALPATLRRLGGRLVALQRRADVPRDDGGLRGGDVLAVGGELFGPFLVLLGLGLQLAADAVDLGLDLVRLVTPRFARPVLADGQL